jgi:hypothetical protein
LLGRLDDFTLAGKQEVDDQRIEALFTAEGQQRLISVGSLENVGSFRLETVGNDFAGIAMRTRQENGSLAKRFGHNSSFLTSYLSRFYAIDRVLRGVSRSAEAVAHCPGCETLCLKCPYEGSSDIPTVRGITIAAVLAGIRPVGARRLRALPGHQEN